MSEPPTVRVENQLIRFVPPIPIELDVAVIKLGAIRQDDFAVLNIGLCNAKESEPLIKTNKQTNKQTNKPCLEILKPLTSDPQGLFC